MDVEYLFDLVRKYGLRKCLRVVSKMSWYLFPFVLFWMTYETLGPIQFLEDKAVYGLIYIAFALAGYVASLISLLALETGILAKIEHVKSVFEKPDDKISEQKFRSECQKTMLPYIYYEEIMVAAVSTSNKIVLISLPSTLLTLFASYSIFHYIVRSQSYIVSFVSWIETVLPVAKMFTNFVVTETRIFLVLIFVLSIPTSMTFRLRKDLKKKILVMLAILDFSYAILTRIIDVVLDTIYAVLRWKQRHNELIYKPFTFPQSLHLAMQTATDNVGLGPCRVSSFRFAVESEEDINRLVTDISKDKRVPSFVRLISLLVNPKLALERVRKLRPELYLGFINDKCIVAGKVTFDVEDAVRKAELTFRNPFVREEFRLIAEKEIDAQRTLKTSLPKSLNEMLSKIRSDVRGQ